MAKPWLLAGGWAYSCKGGQGQPPSSGEGTYTFMGDTAYSMKMVMTSQHQGKPQNMTMEGQGKWLAADCGNVKPMQGPGAKK